MESGLYIVEMYCFGREEKKEILIKFIFSAKKHPTVVHPVICLRVTK